MRRSVFVGGAALLLAGTGSLAASAPANKTQAPVGEPNLVTMLPISVPIIDGDRLDGSFRLNTVLDATDEAAAERVTAALPRLRSATLAAALEFARLHASPMRPVDAEMLSQNLTRALQHEEPGIERALVVEVATHPA
jgi:hypothetical protein